VNKIKEILEGFFGDNEHVWHALFEVVKTKGVSMILSSSEKSVNIVNFPVPSIKALKADEKISELLAELKEVNGVSYMINHDSEKHDTPLLSICPSGNGMSDKEKENFFTQYLSYNKETYDSLIGDKRREERKEANKSK